MRKKKPKDDHSIPLFPDYDEYVSRVNAEKKRQREKAEREAEWRKIGDEIITWLFGGDTQTNAHQRENTKIAKIITIDI